MTSEQHRRALFVVDPSFIRDAVGAQCWPVVSALLRVNALTCCKGAEHGWPGASFSCVEQLFVLHSTEKIDHVVLSKGHAAAAQYAVLHATGKLQGDLRDYKNYRPCDGQDWSKHLEAHADIMCDTGSLGTCLSTVAGMAAANPKERYAIVLGDGELQEGQNYEALMSIRHLNLRNIVILVDRNGFQSDNKCGEMMPIYSLPTVLKGFGFTPMVINGHDVRQVQDAVNHALDNATECPTVVIADTIKGGGTAHMPSEGHPVTQREWQPWHTRIPNWALYCEIIDEQLSAAATAATKIEAELVPKVKVLREEWETHKATAISDPISMSNTHRPSHGALKGTGAAFGELLSSLAVDDNSLAIVSVDLAGSCGVNSAVGKPRFYELGIAEQDAASFAGGLSLAAETSKHPRCFPVVCTYSNFLKRCYENISLNIAQGAHCIYAGHYSGLCYHTDGKSHQSINDTSVFSALQGLAVVDPLNACHAAMCLRYALSKRDQSYYFRLRRTPSVRLEAVAALESEADPTAPLSVHRTRGDATSGPQVFVTMGTVATQAAIECCDAWARGATVIAVPVILRKGTDFLHSDKLSALLAENPYRQGPNLQQDRIFTIEDDTGALNSLVHKYAPQGSMIVGRTVTRVGPSCRRLEDSLAFHGFTSDALKELWFNSSS